MEEKIYRKQVYKGGLFRTGTEEGIQTAYFSSQVSPQADHLNCCYALLIHAVYYQGL